MSSPAPEPADAPAMPGREATPVPVGLAPVRLFMGIHLIGLLPALAAGLVVFGWRAALVLLGVVGGALAGNAVWRRVGRRGRHLGALHACWLACLLAALLPAHFASSWAWVDGVPTDIGPLGLWPLLPVAGLLVVIFNWLLGGFAGGRINPALAAYLVLVPLTGAAVIPHAALNRHRAVTGDVLDVRPHPVGQLVRTPWVLRDAAQAFDPEPASATWTVPASVRLSLYTLGIDRPERRQITLESLLRDSMPPMEDLIVAGHPAPIGLASAVAILAGGLFLIYRGVADPRIPLTILAAAYATFLFAPVPSAIRPDGPVWTTLVDPIVIDPAIAWDVALTFVHYELLAGPMLFIAFYLAPLPSLRPLGGQSRLLYGTLLGALMALSQLYASVPHGPFVALLAVNLLTPLLDRAGRARTLI